MTLPMHKSVLLDEVIQILNLKNGLTCVDCTLGLGGHSEKILKKIVPDGHLYGFEWDKKNAERAENKLKKYAKNCTIIGKNFIHLEEEIKEADRILFDLGISSPHLDSDERGFSFKKEAILDMRMSDDTSLTAYQVVNTYPQEKLAEIIFKYGEEKDSRRIAKNISKYRKNKKIENTTELVEIIKKSKRQGRWGGKNPATQTFQAIRIEVNNELENIEKALQGAMKILKKDGIIAVITFHSLEDRIVKNIFREASKNCKCPKELPKCICNGPEYKLLSRKPIIPTEKEITENPRSRSAKLRAIQKLI